MPVYSSLPEGCLTTLSPLRILPLVTIRPRSKATSGRVWLSWLVWFGLSLLAAYARGAATNDSARLPSTLPDWKLELIAESPKIQHPSVVCTAPDGRVFLAEDPMDISTDHADVTQGRIVCLRPDGTLTVFATHLHAVFGMKYLEGKVYVLHNPKFTVFTDSDGVGVERMDLIESTNPEPWAKDWNDHIPANFILGMDGYFYLAVGDKGIYGAVGRDGKRVDLFGGGVLRLRPDGTELEVFSTGVRNILDVARTEEDELFTYDNTDEQHWMSRLAHMVSGGYYGYPYDFHPRQPWILGCIADYGAGAATGAFADTEAALPGRYHGSLFLADFGKRQILNVRLERNGATFRAYDPIDLFPDAPGDFRPVGICPTADGTGLYLCDWQHRDTKEKVSVGRLFRLTHRDPVISAPKPTWFEASASGKKVDVSTADLIAALEHPAHSVRLTAQRRLAERGTEVVSQLSDVLENPRASAQSRWHAIWALDAVDGGEAAREVLRTSVYSLEPSVRRQAIRQLGQRRAKDALPELIGRLEDEDASVRFQAATALGRIADSEAIQPLETALLRGEEDEIARFAMFTALNHIGRSNPSTWSKMVPVLASRLPEHRDLALLTFRETYDPALTRALEEFVGNREISLPRRAVAIQLLSSLYLQPAPWTGNWWVYHPVNQPPPAKSLHWAGSTTLAATLSGLLDDPEMEIRRLAVQAIADGTVTVAARDLRALFDRESNPELRRLALKTLGRLHDTNAGPLLVSLLETPQPSAELLQEALLAAALIGSPSNHLTPALGFAASALLEKTTDPILVVGAIETLAALQDPSTQPALAKRIRDTNSAVAVSAIRGLAQMRAPWADLSSGLDESRPELQRASMAAATSLKAREAVPRLLQLSTNAALREDAVRSLNAMPDLRSLDLFLSELEDKSFTRREQAQRALQSIRKEALPLIETRVPGLSDDVVSSLQQLYTGDESARKGPIFTQTKKGKQPEDYLEFALAHTGNPIEGQRHFVNLAGTACARCHRVYEHGGDVGPDLSGIGSQFDRRALAESILWPSRAVREGYQQTVLELRNGELLAGLVKSESGESLTLRDAEGKNQTVLKTEIANRSSSALSLMPEGLHSALTTEEFADLVSFLESLKGSTRAAQLTAPDGFTSLFTGTNLSGWKAEGDAVLHWSARDGVLEHDGIARDLWTEQEFADFRLQLEWRWPDPPILVNFPLMDLDGNPVKDAQGKEVTKPVLDAGDSGILLRGLYKAQANLFCYPIGSGGVWEYRTDSKLSAEVHKMVTPKKQADRPIGSWNEMEIVVRGEQLTVRLNGQEVISEAALPGLPVRGPIGLKHEHGRIQFRNLFVQPLEAKP